MRSFSLLTLGLAIIGAYANLTIRAPDGLEVSLSTPADKVSSASEIRVVATVKNVGDKDLKVVRFGSVLDNKRPTRSFIVTKDGKEVPFTGIEASFSLDHLSKDDLVVIHTGENVTTEHDVSTVYDFSTTGPGTFTFKPVSSFQVIGVDDAIETISNTNVDNARPVSITITDDVFKRELDLEKRVDSNCTDGDKRFAIGFGLAEAKDLASKAAAYISYNGNEYKHYKDYFGTNPIQFVINNFNTVANDNLSVKSANCDSDPYYACDTRTLYTTQQEIYYCPRYYHLRTAAWLCSDNPAKAKHVVGISSLFALLSTNHIAGTVNGETDCNKVTNLLKEEKLKNAMNYMCFAAQVYINTICPQFGEA